MNVDFFFGPGSRYSYLASTQLDRLASETGARFRWRVALSTDLAARAGSTLLSSGVGQYAAAYRLGDIRRWAAYYDVPFVDTDPATLEWRQVVLACAAADILGFGETFARAFMNQFHAKGRAVNGLAGLQKLADNAGGSGLDLAETMMQTATSERCEANLADAAAVGAFGVPSFVTEDGALFWGQDRLPLLRHHLSLHRNGETPA